MGTRNSIAWCSELDARDAVCAASPKYARALLWATQAQLCECSKLADLDSCVCSPLQMLEGSTRPACSSTKPACSSTNPACSSCTRLPDELVDLVLRSARLRNHFSVAVQTSRAEQQH